PSSFCSIRTSAPCVGGWVTLRTLTLEPPGLRMIVTPQRSHRDLSRFSRIASIPRSSVDRPRARLGHSNADERGLALVVEHPAARLRWGGHCGLPRVRWGSGVPDVGACD